MRRHRPLKLVGRESLIFIVIYIRLACALLHLIRVCLIPDRPLIPKPFLTPAVLRLDIHIYPWPSKDVVVPLAQTAEHILYVYKSISELTSLVAQAWGSQLK